MEELKPKGADSFLVELSLFRRELKVKVEELLLKVYSFYNKILIWYVSPTPSQYLIFILSHNDNCLAFYTSLTGSETIMT